MNKKIIYGFVAVLLLAILAVGFLFLKNINQQPGKYDQFAKCIKDGGAVFYGAFWCSHCQSQKELFGSSAQYLPYTECSAPDGNTQNTVCKEAKIKGYPTWQFKDGSRNEGELPLADLAQKTGCQLPN